MRVETNEVRIKLHIISDKDSIVKNQWMSLNYNQKPTISHIVEHIKRNLYSTDPTFMSLRNNLNDDDEMPFSVKLYLDDYWLPSCENSRLIRENDCIKYVSI